MSFERPRGFGHTSLPPTRRRSRGWSAVRSLVVGAALVFGANAAAQAAAPSCEAHLAAGLGAASLELPADGRSAVRALRVAVERVEPALPTLAARGELPIGSEDPAYDDADYLARRDLLPAAWRPDALDAATWTTMLARFASWYELPPHPVDAPVTRGDLVDDLTALLGRVGEAVRPLALIAWHPERGDALGFVALVWNWSVYPRLIVHRPPPGATLTSMGGLEGAAASLSNCAVRVESYLAAPVGVATDLYLGAPDARMVLVAAEPTVPTVPYWVPEGEEVAVFGFESGAVAELDAYAAAFAGAALGPVRLLQLLPRLRTNLGPRSALRYLATPER